MLRLRYHTERTSSCRDPTFDVGGCEDFMLLRLPANFVDATRTSDNVEVFVGRVKIFSDERIIALLSDSHGLWQDLRNHCVPIFAHFLGPDNEIVSYTVMPCLHPVHRPHWDCSFEIVEMIDHIRTGLVFMNERGVAHRTTARIRPS